MQIVKLKNNYGLYDILLANNNTILSIYQGIDGIVISCRYNVFKDIKEISFNINKKDEDVYNIFNDFYEQSKGERYLCANYFSKCPNEFTITKDDDNLYLNFKKLSDLAYYKPSSVITLIVSEFYEFHKLFEQLQQVDTKENVKKLTK